MNDPTKTPTDAIHDAVRRNYARIAEREGSCCSSSCCSSASPEPCNVSSRVGYSAAELAAAPAESNMGLGCGNPQAIAALKEGEIVLDLGSGGGFDVFIAGQKVGSAGRVIGVDMTPEMLAKARRNIEAYRRNTRLENVEFRLGEIEHLPLKDASVDVVISNCVINLSPDKAQVCREVFRVLKPGGRTAISDVVAFKALPDEVKHSLEAYTGCVAGAALVSDVEKMLREAGFAEVKVEIKEESREFIKDWFRGSGVEDYVASAAIACKKGR
jgi:SAM-dependent methyltransferase